jgi:hypothetical protein
LVAQSQKFSKHSFFLAPTLRGICEDFIALVFINKKRKTKERHGLIENKMLQQVIDAVEKQRAFFKKHRPFLNGIVILEQQLANALRWPEAITFAEMNLKSPSQFIRILLKSTCNIRKRKKHLAV